ncbi:MAG: SurA N-terminal domain-containing protein [Acidobacteriota bacterium]|nr:SurA N-terminal domain-containing protein [Acidobacteriota bacterium]
MPFAFCLLPSRACGQEVVDRMVAVVNDTGLITYSDLLWQLALQPSVPLDRPRRDDLRGALDLLIGQRLILQEAEKLPAVAPTQKEIDDETTRLIGFFPSQAAFYERLARVGLGQDSAQLREIISDRVRIQKYLDFRFGSFVVVTPKEVEDYYRDVYVPRWRRQSPGVVVPVLDKVRDQIQRELTEGKKESDTDNFLEQARAAAQITILDPTLAGEKAGGK